MVKVYNPPEVYTSYFARVPALLKEGFRREEMTGIVRKRMPFIDKRIRNCAALSPFPSLLEGYKKGLIDEFSFSILYRDWLDLHIDAAGTIATIRRMGLKVFLCYEAGGKFCHRHIFAEWLTAHGLRCEEWAPTFDYPSPDKWKPSARPMPPDTATALVPVFLP